MFTENAKPYSSRKLFVLIVSCATFLAVIYGARTLFASVARQQPIDWVRQFGFEFVYWYVWAALTPVVIWFARAPRRLDRAAVVATAAILAHSAVDYPARTTMIAIILAAGLALMTTRVAKVKEETASSGGRHLKAE